MTGVLDEDIINEGVIDTIEQLLQWYDVCMYCIVDWLWLGCPKCLTRVLWSMTGVLDVNLVYVGVIDTIEKILQDMMSVCII